MTHERVGFWCVGKQTRVGVARRGGISQRDLNAVVRAGVDAQAFIDRATSHDRVVLNARMAMASGCS